MFSLAVPYYSSFTSRESEFKTKCGIQLMMMHNECNANSGCFYSLRRAMMEAGVDKLSSDKARLP